MVTELEPGTFGENLTLDGLESARLNVGDMLHSGAVTLQVTAARIPCATLAARMGDPGFVKRFRLAGRPGAYCRVLRTGMLQAGAPVTLERYTAVAAWNYLTTPLREAGITDELLVREVSLLWRAVMALTIGYSAFIAEVFRAHYDPQHDAEMIRRHLAAPIAARVRAAMAEKARKGAQ